MSLNITKFNQLQLRSGAMPPAPMLDGNAVAQVVALAAASAVLTGPCLVCLIPDEDQRISIDQTAGYNAPAADAIKLKSGVERYFEIPAGSWYINAVAG